MKINGRHRLSTIVAGLAPVIFVAPTLADMSEMTWNLTESNTFADGPVWATVNIKADTADGTVKFTVDALNVQPQYGTLNNFGIDNFGFNYNANVDGPSDWTVALPTGWSEAENKNLSEFGVFLVQEKQGGGGDEQDPLMFTLTLDTFSQAVAGNFAFGADGGTGVFFAAHIRGINQSDGEGDIGSHWVGGGDPIPAPGAALLAMIGFGIVGKLKRRFA